MTDGDKIDKFMPAKNETEQMARQRRAEMEKYADYQNYLKLMEGETTDPPAATPG